MDHGLTNSGCQCGTVCIFVGGWTPFENKQTESTACVYLLTQLQQRHKPTHAHAHIIDEYCSLLFPLLMALPFSFAFFLGLACFSLSLSFALFCPEKMSGGRGNRRSSKTEEEQPFFFFFLLIRWWSQKRIPSFFFIYFPAFMVIHTNYTSTLFSTMSCSWMDNLVLIKERLE